MADALERITLMHCPHCGADDSRVLDSRAGADGVRRRRVCPQCGGRFTTRERIELAPLLVVKRDGRREPFSRDKMLAGLRRACEKRPLAVQALEALADRVEAGALAGGHAETPSTAVGELIMAELRELDQIAYVRFACVYRSFADVASLQMALAELQGEPPASVGRAAVAVSGGRASVDGGAKPNPRGSTAMPVVDVTLSPESESPRRGWREQAGVPG